MKFYNVFYSFILSRRYRVKIEGLDLLKKEGSKLILPNHQSHIDPQLIALESSKYSNIVPVVSEKFYNTPVIHYFLKKWEAVSVSDLKAGNRDPNVMKNIFSKVIDALENDKSVIIYPSGMIQETGIEKVKNKQAAHKIIAQLPEKTTILGLRIKGLWGSTFSCAWNGTRPKFLLVFLKGIGYLFANLIFFSPRRTVTFEFVDITEEAKKQVVNDRRTFNKYLEAFYNKDGFQEPNYVRHFFFLPKFKRKIPDNILNAEKTVQK